jgi:hypothetical protein
MLRDPAGGRDLEQRGPSTGEQTYAIERGNLRFTELTH